MSGYASAPHHARKSDTDPLMVGIAQAPNSTTVTTWAPDIAPPPGPAVADIAIKHDAGKIPMELLPAPALEEIARVLQFGAKKYAAWNWAKGFGWTRLAGAALRHLFAWVNGEDRDPESGLSHLAHAGCCILFLITHERCGLGTDDRHRLNTK